MIGVLLNMKFWIIKIAFVELVTAACISSVMKKLGMVQVGRHHYDSQAKFTVACRDAKFELWPGFMTSILRYENNVMLCAEVSHKVGTDLLRSIKLLTQ